MNVILGPNSIDFADIPNQINRRAMNRTYEFNLMLVGLARMGKSAIVNSLFRGMIKPKETVNSELNFYEAELEENGVKLQVRCIETSNFDRHEPVAYVKFIEEQFQSYFKLQRRESSPLIKDPLIHCCIYLIPSCWGTKPRKEDLDCMLALHEKVNLVPVIAKPDTFDKIQLDEFKDNITKALLDHNIQYYEFKCDEKEDEDRSKAIKLQADRFPFAVVAADKPIEDGKKIRWIRNTMGGPIDILDSKVCDFDALAKLLIRYCMLDLIDTTHIKHYAKFKKTTLDKAKEQNGKNLQAMGLKPHEIERILGDINPELHKNKLSIEEQRAVLEKELQQLRKRLENLKTHSLKISNK